MPVCIWCKKEKNNDEFGKGIWKDRRNHRCKECERNRCKKTYHNNLEKYRNRSLKNFKKNREKYIKNNKERERKVKERIFNYYGGYKCACCGETIKKFLTIDHINGGGTKHRRETKGGGRTTYRWILKNNFPIGFQVLCMNCNFGKGQNNGICPHIELEKSPSIIAGKGENS